MHLALVSLHAFNTYVHTARIQEPLSQLRVLTKPTSSLPSSSLSILLLLFPPPPPPPSILLLPSSSSSSGPRRLHPGHFHGRAHLCLRSQQAGPGPNSNKKKSQPAPYSQKKKKRKEKPRRLPVLRSCLLPTMVLNSVYGAVHDLRVRKSKSRL